MVFSVLNLKILAKNCAYLSPGRWIQRVKDSSKRNFPRTLWASLREPDTSNEQGTEAITARSRKGVADPLLTPAMLLSSAAQRKRQKHFGITCPTMATKFSGDKRSDALWQE